MNTNQILFTKLFQDMGQLFNMNQEMKDLKPKNQTKHEIYKHKHMNQGIDMFEQKSMDMLNLKNQGVLMNSKPMLNQNEYRIAKQNDGVGNEQEPCEQISTDNMSGYIAFFVTHEYL